MARVSQFGDRIVAHRPPVSDPETVALGVLHAIDDDARVIHASHDRGHPLELRPIAGSCASEDSGLSVSLRCHLCTH